MIQKDIRTEEGRSLLRQGAKMLGVDLTPIQVDQFLSFLSLMETWNRHINLTGLRSWREIIIKHFLDSLAPLPYLPVEARLLDLGSGAGFPGIPIKIVRPTQPLSLIEASAKKVSFLKEVVRSLKLSTISIHQGYLGKDSSTLLPGALFDMIITRAVGNWADWLRGVRSFLVPRGKVVLLKGRKELEEFFLERTEIEKWGFEFEASFELTVPFLEQERTLLVLTRRS